MKIHVTKAGRAIVACFIIVVIIFFLCGGAAAVVKIVEKYRVNSFPPLPAQFSNSDISFNNWATLGSSFRGRHASIKASLDKLRKMEKDYPQNNVLKTKISQYQSYLNSMEETSFECPEHINTGTERRSRACSNCDGDGWKIWQLPPGDCSECGGSGKIGYTVSISCDCPHCGTNYKSPIPARKLLN